jgi:hypothetical protein
VPVQDQEESEAAMTTSKLTIRVAKIRDGCWRRELEKAVSQQMRFMKDCCAARFAISYVYCETATQLAGHKEAVSPFEGYCEKR